jgi:hypothetical protein
MKFFLDENFPRPALAQLQSAGHTAVHALAALGERKLDDSVWLVTDTRIYSRQKK